MILNKTLQQVLKNKIISGVGDGEKVMLCGQINRQIFLSSDFVSAGKVKRGLENLGQRVEIISSSRENNDANDKNLLPFASGITKYLSGELDCLIFLPCSMIIKFDLSKFEPIILKKDETIDLKHLI